MANNGRYIFKLFLLSLVVLQATHPKGFYNPETLYRLNQALLKNKQQHFNPKRNITGFEIPAIIAAIAAVKSVATVVAATGVTAAAIWVMKGAKEEQDKQVADAFLAAQNKEAEKQGGPVKYNDGTTSFHGTPIKVTVIEPEAEKPKDGCIVGIPTLELPKPNPEPEKPKVGCGTGLIIEPEKPKPCGHSVNVISEPKTNCGLVIPEMPKVTQVVGAAASGVLIMAKEVTEHQKKDAEKLANMTPEQIAALELSKTPETHKSEFEQLKNGQGFKDKDGNIWTLDKYHHSDHWDVADKNGKAIKEVSRGGRDLDGTKNKSGNKIMSSGSDRSTRIPANGRAEFVAHVISQVTKTQCEEPQHATIDLRDEDIDRASQEIDAEMEKITQEQARIAEIIKEKEAALQKSEEEDRDYEERKEWNRRDDEYKAEQRARDHASGYSRFSDDDMASFARQMDEADFSNPLAEATSDYYAAHHAPSTEEYNAGWAAFSAANGVPYEPSAE